MSERLALDHEGLFRSLVRCGAPPPVLRLEISRLPICADAPPAVRALVTEMKQTARHAFCALARGEARVDGYANRSRHLAADE